MHANSAEGHVRPGELTARYTRVQTSCAGSTYVISDGATQSLRRAFIARYGPSLAEEVLAETVAWAWEHRTEVDSADNQLGLLFRVGQSKSRRFLRWTRAPHFPPHPGTEQLTPEPRLGESLRALSDAQRTAVLLVHAYQWTYAEVAALLGCSEGAVTNHVHRGLKKLRTKLGGIDER
jgi:DNA-directed RNA polymerase specialized sigma24 family protein